MLTKSSNTLRSTRQNYLHALIRTASTCMNGILDVHTGELAPHSPAFLSPVRIPITYDAAAKCPMIEEFIQQVFPHDSLELAWEILGDLITADRSIQKAICVLGEGGNGKSVFLPALYEFRR